jgi:hypothetical protein
METHIGYVRGHPIVTFPNPISNETNRGLGQQKRNNPTSAKEHLTTLALKPATETSFIVVRNIQLSTKWFYFSEI